MPEAIDAKPKRKIIDWQPIKADFESGIAPKELSDKYSHLRISPLQISVQASQEQWINPRKKRKTAVQKIAKSLTKSINRKLTKGTDNILSQAHRFIQIAQQDAIEKLEHYTKYLPKPDDWRTAANAERALSSVTSRGYTVFGLNKPSDSHVTVNFGIVPPNLANSTKLLGDLAKDQPIIDVDHISPDDPGQGNAS